MGDRSSITAIRISVCVSKDSRSLTRSPNRTTPGHDRHRHRLADRSMVFSFLGIARPMTRVSRVHWARVAGGNLDFGSPEPNGDEIAIGDLRQHCRRYQENARSRSPATSEDKIRRHQTPASRRKAAWSNGADDYSTARRRDRRERCPSPSTEREASPCTLTGSTRLTGPGT